MNKISTAVYRDGITRALDAGSTGRAIEALENMAIAAGAAAPVRDDIRRLTEDYALLKRYALDGADDPQRPAMLARMRANILAIADSIDRTLLIEESPRAYFAAARYSRMRHDDTIAALAADYSATAGRLGLSAMSGSAGDGATSLRKHRAELWEDLFNRIWTTHPLSRADADAIMALMADETVDDHARLLLVSALLLGCLDYHDDKRLYLLTRIYLSRRESATGVAALCALLLAMWAGRRNPLSAATAQALASAADAPGWRDDVRMAMMTFLRARDTERITRKMDEELLPEMMRMQPIINSKLRDLAENPDALDPDDINPEWEEMLEKSGLADKLKELNEIQQDGGDILMGSFGRLKHFPFFRSVYAWFMPFTAEHPDVEVLGLPASLLTVLESTPTICDSDKYSVTFAFGGMPAAQSRMMIEQLKAQGINDAEIESAALNASQASRERMASRYVQGVYRFFKLFRRKQEFADPFASPVNLTQLEPVAAALSDPDTMALIAEFYFRRGYHAEALGAYSWLIDHGAGDAATYQKTGACHQALGEHAKALTMYEYADLINPSDKWTIRRMAQCHAALAHWQQALDAYTALDELRPDNESVTLNIANCLIHLRHYSKALKALHKAEFLKPESVRARRPIMWCAMMTGDFQRAHRYCDMILAASPQADDWLNAGHLAMLERRLRDAVEAYRHYCALRPAGAPSLRESIAVDLAGCDPASLPSRDVTDIIIEESES